MSRTAIQTITIHDFRGFPGDSVSSIILSGKSLLLYGENGSGKSTLFHALKDLFDRKADFTKNVFSNAPDTTGKISLCFGVKDVSTTMDWQKSSREHPLEHEYFTTIERTAGFLDYRAILRTHFVDNSKGEINIFALVVEILLKNIEFITDTTKIFGVEWDNLNEDIKFFNSLPKKSPPLKNKAGLHNTDALNRLRFNPSDWRGDDEEYSENDEDEDNYDIQARYQLYKNSRLSDIKDEISNFYTALKQRLVEIQNKANEYLKRFDPWLEIRFGVSDLQVKEDYLEHFPKSRLLLQARYRNHNVENPSLFLNEARLTSIALVIYLAALKLETPLSANPNDPRLLVLDDVLIGLDMANRHPVLDIVRTEFTGQGWQVLLMTYDRLWFDIIKSHVGDSWALYEMFAIRVGDYEQSLLKPCDDNITRAKRFLENGEIKAAAVHIRSEYEIILKKACEEWSIPVRYKKDSRKMDTSFFWEALKKHKYRDSLIINKDLSERVEFAASWILNPLSHSNSVDSYGLELQKAIDTIDELKNAIRKTS